jgi:predicted deacylase
MPIKLMTKIIVSFILCSLYSLAFAQKHTFILDGYQVKEGEKLSFNMLVKSPSGDSTYIPITVIHGSKPGPVLGLLSGVHGYEYPPIIALQQLPALLDPANISGTIVLIHVANVNAFLNRSIYYNPIDHKNLNRVFPGNKNGTITECIAWAISHILFPRFNYLIDVHAGDANEDLHPYVGYVAHGNQTAIAKKMAEAMGFDWIMRAERSITDSLPTQYATSEAVAQGIPALAIECGKLGTATQAEVEKINNGIINVMRTLRLMPDTPSPTNISFEITKRITINSEYTGIFYSDCKSGQLVRKGMKIGSITDLLGKPLQDIISPIDGFIIYMIGTPPINKGELLFNLGQYPQ